MGHFLGINFTYLLGLMQKYLFDFLSNYIFKVGIVEMKGILKVNSQFYQLAEVALEC